jgi:hypothetical protein
MVTYHLPVPATIASVPVHGRYLAHNQYDRVGRAFLAADLVTGVTHLVEPTVTQAAALAGCSRAYAHAAIKRLDERQAIESGYVPLVPAGNVSKKTNGGLGEIDDFALAQIAHTVGPDRMVAAAIAAEAHSKFTVSAAPGRRSQIAGGFFFGEKTR